MRHLWEFSEPLICLQTLTKREKSKRRESSTETEYGAHLKWIHSKHPLLLKQLKDLYCREQSWNKHVQLGAQDFPPTAVWEEGRHCLGHVVFVFPLFPYQRQIREPEKRIISSIWERRYEEAAGISVSDVLAQSLDLLSLPCPVRETCQDRRGQDNLPFFIPAKTWESLCILKGLETAMEDRWHKIG